MSPNAETAQHKPVREDKSKPDAKAQAKVDLKPGAKSESKDDLKSLPMAELQAKLGSTPEGLSQDEAQKRLTQYGPNEIAEKKTNAFLKFLSYFWGPIPWMIEGAVILSGVVKHWLDFFIILFLLCSNAVVAFWEERQAGNAIAALKATLATKARAKRDGKWATPKASELVPGDVIRLRLGDIVPADARLLTGDPVQVDQSALTGESLPATRKSGEAVFSGSIIRKGEIDAMVYATGTNTYFGKTVQLVEEAHTVSHFQKSVLKIGNYLIVLAVALVAVIVTVALLRHDPVLEVFSFKQPSAEELEHDFLWRTTRHLPERGRIGMFNRSYYEEVLVVRVHPEILRSQGLSEELRNDKAIWEGRYRSIVDMEGHLHRNGTKIVKIFLHLSKEEQRKRFLERIDEPDKNWKFSLSDIHERKYWKQYVKAYEACLRATSTHHAPWYVVPADDKENARLIVSRIVLDGLEGLKMAYPKTTTKRKAELESIRKQLQKK